MNQTVGDGRGETRISINVADNFANVRLPHPRSFRDGDSVEITFGQEGRPHDIMPFAKSHVVLLCFAVDSVESLDSVRTKWSPYVDEYCRWRRVILVCCKRDIRDAMTEENYSPGMVKAEQGMELAGQIGAYRYVECSAYTGEGVKELLEHAARLSRIPVTPISPAVRKRARHQRLSLYKKRRDFRSCSLTHGVSDLYCEVVRWLWQDKEKRPYSWE
ncbi:ras-like protein family, member C [Zopfochytrium polystomum]|nr:ras-like protein family, member C [Zopfochytrium polystomum]